MCLRNLSGEEEKSIEKLIDKVSFFEYCQLPGILSDRFFRMFIGSKAKTEAINKSQFVDGMIKIFMSDFDSKMRFTFDMYSIF